MSKNDPLDRPITLRELKDAYDEAIRGRAVPPNAFRRTVDAMVEAASTTDFITVTFGSKREYTYRVDKQPARRVQVGDLVTVTPNGFSTAPQVARVRRINVEGPKTSFARAVAISPEDAERIEASLGKVK